jgi:hypothetical protein
MSFALYETPEWPASPEHLSAARQFLKSISSKEDDRPVLIVPDRDVDGLTSAGILYRVVSRILLKNRGNIKVRVQFVTKGAWIGDAAEKAAIDTAGARCHIRTAADKVMSSFWIRDHADHRLSRQMPKSSLSITIFLRCSLRTL